MRKEADKEVHISSRLVSRLTGCQEKTAGDLTEQAHTHMQAHTHAHTLIQDTNVFYFTGIECTHISIRVL